jgi:serine/tyrosine/threonine adenylyltransferase
VVCRVAKSFTRFGNFEILAARNDIELLKHLVDFTIRADFPQLISENTDSENNVPENYASEKNTELNAEIYVKWFSEICKLTAHMIAHWMRVGFVHGVMNTDNMSILGLTIDYGPYGWLEGYEPDWTPNTTDAQHHRYCFINQPHIALWNLTQLANALYPLINSTEPLQQALHSYRTEYAAQWQRDMANKLGLHEFIESDIELVDELHTILQIVETDMTIFYRLLANINVQENNVNVQANTVAAQSDAELIATIAAAYYETPTAQASTKMAAWLRAYGKRLLHDVNHYGQTDIQRKLCMNKTNPKYVLRNYMAQQAIDKATQGDYSEIKNVLQLLRKPYAEQPECEHYFAKRPEWARNKAGCSMLSCSS